MTVISRADDGRLLAKASLRAAERLDVSPAVLAEILGIGEAALASAAYPDGRLDADGEAGARARVWLRIFRALEATLGSSDIAAQRWLVTPNASLHGVAPLERLRTVEGLTEVMQLLDRSPRRF